MGIQHEQEVPPSFSDAFSGSYLGDPAVVGGLVAEYCTGFEQAIYGLAAKEITKSEFDESINAAIRHYADIFSGRSPAYQTIKGYHENTLKYKLMADLGEFWQRRRAKWSDDSVCVLFEWLGANLAESVKRADGDDMLLEIMLKPTYEYTVQVLLGTEKRQ
jgi:hypothetical protein